MARTGFYPAVTTFLHLVAVRVTFPRNTWALCEAPVIERQEPMSIFALGEESADKLSSLAVPADSPRALFHQAPSNQKRHVTFHLLKTTKLKGIQRKDISETSPDDLSISARL